jgi:hypothetical protein
MISAWDAEGMRKRFHLTGDKSVSRVRRDPFCGDRLLSDRFGHLHKRSISNPARGSPAGTAGSYLFWRPFDRRLVRSGYPALVMPGQFKEAFLDEWIGLIGQIPYSSCSFPAELVVHLMSSQTRIGWGRI